DHACLGLPSSEEAHARLCHRGLGGRARVALLDVGMDAACRSDALVAAVGERLLRWVDRRRYWIVSKPGLFKLGLAAFSVLASALLTACHRSDGSDVAGGGPSFVSSNASSHGQAH